MKKRRKASSRESGVGRERNFGENVLEGRKRENEEKKKGKLQRERERES